MEKYTGEKAKTLKDESKAWPILAQVYDGKDKGASGIKGIGFAISDRLVVTGGSFLLEVVKGNKLTVKFPGSQVHGDFTATLIKKAGISIVPYANIGLLQLDRPAPALTVEAFKFSTLSPQKKDTWASMVFYKYDKDPWLSEGVLLGGKVGNPGYKWLSAEDLNPARSETVIELKSDKLPDEIIYQGAPVMVDNQVVGLIDTILENRTHLYALPINRVWELLDINFETRADSPGSGQVTNVEAIANDKFSPLTDQYMALAELIGKYLYGELHECGSIELLAGFLYGSKNETRNHASVFIWKQLKAKYPSKQDLDKLWKRMGWSLGWLENDIAAPVDDAFSPILIEDYRELVEVSKLAKSHVIKTSKSRDEIISLRHMAAAFLFGYGSSGPFAVQEKLRTAGFDLVQWKTDFYKFLEESNFNEDMNEWAEILGIGKDTSVLFNAGFSTDSAGGLDDQLGITDGVKNLCRVIAAKDVEPPLSIGLFGDWGMGKSFFMGHMHDYIKDLADQTRIAGEDDSMFCANVCQIRFNAWHYVDSNLWASFANYIFESLENHLNTEKKKKDETVLTLYEMLESTNRELQDAKDAEENYNNEIDRVSSEIANCENNIRQNEGLLKVLKSQFSLEKELKGVLKETAGEKAPEAVEELKSFWKKFYKTWTFFFGKKKWKLFLFLIIIAIFSFGGYLLSDLIVEGKKWLGSSVSALLSVLVPAWVWFRPKFKKIKQGVDTLDKARRELELSRQTQIAEKQKEVQSLEIQKLNAIERYEKAQENKRNIENQIYEIKSGKSLARFIDERVRSGDYQKHLGLISTIHRDFKRLSDLMDEKVPLEAKLDVLEEKKKIIPRLDRIILYIDDLDRCPETRVVEVLQAVHLLLALKLFVVVVAVDPRWLLHSLRVSYKALREDTDKKGTQPLDKDLWVSTPQHYLEKIFQVPFSLPEMDEKGYGNLIESLVPVVEAAAEQEEKQPEPGTGQKKQTPPKPPLPPEGEPPKEEADEEAVPVVTQPGDKIEEKEKTSKPMPKSEDKTTPPVDLNPAALRLESWEVESMKKMKCMIRSPRMAKSFTNLYRLIRAGIEPDALKDFVGTKEGGGQYEAVLILLSVTVGFSREAPAFFKHLEEFGTKGKDFSEFIKELKTTKTDNLTGVPGELIKKLRLVLPTIKTKYPIEIFQELSKKVTRFSFRSGKI